MMFIEVGRRGGGTHPKNPDKGAGITLTTSISLVIFFIFTLIPTWSKNAGAKSLIIHFSNMLN